MRRRQGFGDILAYVFGRIHGIASLDSDDALMATLNILKTTTPAIKAVRMP